MTVVVGQNQFSSMALEKPTVRAIIQKKCLHCKISYTTLASTSNSDKDDFCCRGCAGAHHLVKNLGLENFYQMTEFQGINKVSDQGNTESTDYQIYDAKDFQLGFVRISPSNESHLEASLHVDGITCYACVWLIKKGLERHFKQPVTMVINQSTGAASLTWHPSTLKLSDLVKFIETLGYHVMPFRGGSLRTDQRAMIRMGVGLFVMTNVMSFAIAEYFAGSEGLEPGIQSFFRWLSLGLTAIALPWTGREFFTNTWRAVKTRTPNIDAPILIGLLAASVWSIHSTIVGHGTVYFDSICSVVALVITGRYMQQNVLRRNQSKMSTLINPKDGWVLVERTNSSEQQVWQPIRASSVKTNEKIKILPGEMFPLKVTCTTPCAEVSYEQLRGETDWKTVHKGDAIPAGALNGSTTLEVVAAQNGAESYTESLMKSISRAIDEKGLYQKWSDQAAWLLFLIVFGIAAIVLLIEGRTHLEEACQRVVALLLIACPCTFAIGVPLTFGTSMTLALRDGILFKSQRALEKLSGIQHFVFDKTGTLTTGAITVKTWTWNLNYFSNASSTRKQATSLKQSLILSQLGILDQYSSHHVARAVALFARLSVEPTKSLPQYASEAQGLGLELAFDSDRMVLGKKAFLDQLGIKIPLEINRKSSVYLAINNEVVATAELDDTTRSEAARAIEDLKSMNCEVEILSGDSQDRTNRMATELKIDPNQAFGEATPSSKLLYVKNFSNKLHSSSPGIAMVGNGLNDAGAMAQATVSLAVAGSSSSAMNSADLCLLKDDIGLVGDALRYARATTARIKYVFGFATLYNSFGIMLAATGHVTPVVAAILMPISSLTITHLATAWTIRSREQDTAATKNGRSL